MKKMIVGVIIAMAFAGQTMAVELSDLQQKVFQLAASGWVDLVTTHLTGVSTAWRARGGVEKEGANWLFIEAAQSDSLNQEFPVEVYTNFLSRFDRDSLLYGDVVVAEDNTAPTGCSVSGANEITCDVPTNGKTLTLFSWDFVSFTDTEKVAVDGVFSGVSAGNYVVGFTGAEFCTPFLTVPYF
jgi:hypothetical protein